MNRYITRGILDDLAAGRSVLVISATLRESATAHDAVLALLYAGAFEADQGDGYAWSLANGGQWIRDERTKVAATFVSYGSTMVDHAGGDVVVVNGYRRIIGDGHDLEATDRAVRRLHGIIGDRDRVVID